MRNPISFSLATIVLLYFNSYDLFAQNQLMSFFSNEFETIWHSGEIKKRSGETINGEVTIDFKYDAVRIKDKEDKVKTYTASKVDYVSYIDSEYGYKRVLYSLPFKNEMTGHFGPTFFELIKDVDDFALLSRLRYRIIETGGGGTPGTTVNSPGGEAYFPATPGAPLRKIHIEDIVLYLINRKGEIKPYVLIKANDTKGTIISIKGRKYIDKKALKEVMGLAYDNCKSYAKDYNLNLKKVDDLVLVLEYYEGLK